MEVLKKPDELQHHGVKGMRWGVRRFQNKDGSLTPAGQKRAAKLAAKETRDRLKDKQVARRLTIEKAKQQMKEDSLNQEVARKNSTRESKAKAAADKAKAKRDEEETYNLPDDSEESAKKRENGNRLLKGAVAIVGAVVAIYAIKKIREKSGKSDDDPEKAVDDALNKIKSSKKEVKAAAKARDAAAKRVARAHAEAEKASKTATRAAERAKKTAEKAAKAAAKANDKKYKEIADRINKRPTKKQYKDIFNEDTMKNRYGTIADKQAQAALKEKLLSKNGRTTITPAIERSAASGKSVVDDLFKRLAGGS